MNCPICGKLAEKAVRPFCSKRCADIDLNRWLNGSYAVPSQDPEDLDELEQALDEARRADDLSKPH